MEILNVQNKTIGNTIKIVLPIVLPVQKLEIQ